MADQMRIPALSLTAGQQGGIGYPPVLVKLDKWYAVDDSRYRKPPEELDLWWQRGYPKRDPYYHPQTWRWQKWHSAPCLTWDEVLAKCLQA